MRITFFGTGTSHGIPMIGCDCAVCTSSNPRNRRNRTGIWLHDEKISAAIDISSEFRIASLRHGLKHLDFALLTHAHSDHIAGLDDLRIFSQRSGQATPLYGDANTLTGVRERFPYAFAPGKNYGGGVPQFDAREIKNAQPFNWQEWSIVPLPVLHGPEPILGYRVGNFALITDVTFIPDETLAKLQGVDVLALDCLRRAPHSTHLHLQGAIDYALKIQAKRTYMVHLAHDLEHDETEKVLPPHCWVAYDGLELEVA